MYNSDMKLLSESQNKILLTLKKKIVLSVDQITNELRITKTAARRHLLSLERRGLLQRDSRKIGRGRPNLVFRLTPSAHRLFPSKEAEILNDFLEYLSRTGNDALIEDFFEQYWQSRFEAIQKRLQEKGKDDLTTRIQVLKEELEKEGFMPRSRVIRQGQELMLQECHCPIESIISTTRLPCRLEQRLIARVLNAPVTSAKFRESAEDGPCEYRLPISKS